VRDTRRTRLVLLVLLAIALALIAINYSDGSSSAVRDIRNVGADVFGGAEHAVGAVSGFFTRSGSSGQVQTLQKEVAELRAELSQAQLSRSDYAQLRQLLLLAGAGQYRIVAATVIAVGQGFQQTVTLDAGSSAGIRAGDTVLNGQGLVGEVTAVTSSTSTVLLASDSSSGVGVAVAPSGQLGHVTGPGTASGSGLMRLQMLSSAAVLQPGDEMVTAASVPYVPGVPVGTVTTLVNQPGSLTAVAMVRPFVDFSALGVVGVVIVPPASNPRFATLPPLPHPGPTVTVTVTAKPAKPGPNSAPTPGVGG